MPVLALVVHNYSLDHRRRYEIFLSEPLRFLIRAVDSGYMYSELLVHWVNKRTVFSRHPGRKRHSWVCRFFKIFFCSQAHAKERLQRTIAFTNLTYDLSSLHR